MRLASFPVALVLVTALVGGSSARAQTADDPLELRLDRSTLDESILPESGDGEGRTLDLLLTIVSEPNGLGLRATRMFESGRGVERPLCIAPCTTYLERGAYQFRVENKRGRARETPGTYSLDVDGTIFLRMKSRRAVRAAWWTSAAALVGSGLTLFLTQRQPHMRDDPFCTAACTYYTGGQRAAMTVGGLMTMFGLIAMRFGITSRDTGVVDFEPAIRSRHIDPDEAY